MSPPTSFNPPTTVLPTEYDPALVERDNPVTAHLFDYAFLKSVSAAYNEKHDCVVIALSILSGKSYPHIHELLHTLGRRRRCGTPWHITKQAFADLNLQLHPVTITYDGRTVRSVVPQLTSDSSLTQNRYMIKTARHVAAVVNGKCEDWSEDRGLYVQHVYQVLDLHESTPPILLAPPIRPNQPESRARFRHHTYKVSELIRDLASTELSKSTSSSAPPRTRRFWLTLRSRVMAQCEQNDPPIKRSTASIELGKWQDDLGYAMNTLSTDRFIR